MTRQEKRIVQDLGHSFYTVAYLEKWLARTDDSPDTIAARAYYAAVQQRVENVYRIISTKEQSTKDIQLGEAVLKRIDDLSKKQKLSIHELKRRANMARTTLIAVMDGSTLSPNILTIGKIATGLDVSVREFFDCDLFGAAKL